MLKSGRLVPGGVFVFLMSFFLASSSIAAGPDWGAPGGAIPPARPGSLNAVPDPKLRPPLTQTAPAAPAAPETVLTTKGFAFASSLGAPDTEVVQFRVPGPGKVILEASNTGTRLDKLGLIARAPKPPGQSPVDTRWDGPTPLRVEFPVMAQDLANLAPQGNVWIVFITLRDLPPPRGTGGRYAIPGLAAVGNLKVSFVASAPAQKTALEPKAMPNLGTARPGSGVFPAGTPQEAPVKASQPALKTSQPAPAAAQPPKAAGNPPPKTSQPAPAAAQPVEPTWPQPFELGPGERTGFGFVAGKPGPIVVTVQWTGVPLTVSLAKPGGGSIDQQGKGSVTLQYNATADDVKKGVLWGVSLRPTQVALKPATGTGVTLIEKPLKIDMRGLAKGTVNVQHPPGDMNLAQAELKAMAVKAQALKPTSQPVATANVNVLAQKQAAWEKQQTIQNAALRAQVRSKIPVPNAKVSGTVAAAPSLKRVPVPDSDKKLGTVPTMFLNNPSGFKATLRLFGGSLGTTAGYPPPRNEFNQLIFRNARYVILTWDPVPGVSEYEVRGPRGYGVGPQERGSLAYEMGWFEEGFYSWELLSVVPSGSNLTRADGNPSTTSISWGGPAISSLNVPSGSPGTPVLIQGSNFNLNQGGVVHFRYLAGGGLGGTQDIIINGINRNDLLAGWDYNLNTPIPNGSTQWINDQTIIATVPEYGKSWDSYSPESLGYTGEGEVYLKFASGVESNRVPFKIIRTTQFKKLPIYVKDWRIEKGDAGDQMRSYPEPSWWNGAYHKSTLMFGHKGNDYYLENYRLKNGWVLDSIEFWSDFGRNWAFGFDGNESNPLAGAYIVEAAYGTDAPFVKVHWWNIGNCSGYYDIVVFIRGPAGVPYQ